MRVAAFLALLVLLPTVAAHSSGADLPGDTLARATPIRAPARLFESTSAGVEVHYYRLDVTTPEVRLRVVGLPGREPTGLPVLFLFGSGFAENASVPPDVERPEMGGRAFAANGRAEGRIAELGLGVTVLLDRALLLEPGPHWLALRSESAAPIALLVDSPDARWLELFLMPGLRDDARAWSNASVWSALVAGSIGIVIVLAVARWTRGRTWSFHTLGAFACAALAASTGMALATDAARTGVGWVYAGGALLSAAYAIVSTRPPVARPTWFQRALLASAALLSFFVFAGALWGPLAGLAGALLPEPDAIKA